MADNLPVPMGGPVPPLPSSSATGRVPSLTTHLPTKKGGAGKIVVMLSSVAKAPPAGTQSLLSPPISRPPPKLILAPPSEGVSRPPPLPPKQVTPANKLAPPRLSATTQVRMPSKTNPPPRWASLAVSPAAPSVSQTPAAPHGAPPPLPAKGPEPSRSEPKKSGAQHIPPIKLNELSSPTNRSGESIFPDARTPEAEPKPTGWNSLEPGELNRPAENLPKTGIVTGSIPVSGEPASISETKEKTGPVTAPPLLPSARVETDAPMGGEPSVRPPPLPPPVAREMPWESPVPPPPVQIAPPLLKKKSEPAPEKLPPPLFPVEVRQGETPPDLPKSAGVHKVPGLIHSEERSTGPQPSALSAPPLLPPTAPGFTGASHGQKKSIPLVLSSTSKVRWQRIADAKSARSPGAPVHIPLSAPVVAEKKAVEEPVAAAPVQLPEPKAALPPPAEATPSVSVEKPPVVEKDLAPQAPPALPPSAAPVPVATKRAVPETRAVRAKKRRIGEAVIFWAVLVPLTVAALVVGTLYFCRETRVEGQVIPPPGMTLNSEAWLVTNFSSYAAGIADDLAKERTPLLQEIQERQQHVQRARADVAAREERIRLIEDEIQGAQDEIASVVKQSREATQKIWDGEGAQIDEEYTSRFNQLQAAIADRAQSLKLKYQPDPNFPSPEVWANAYRLALYQVPTGVDGVKEHQWLSDQMTLWRSFLKTLDDRKEKLRDEAAQIKLAPASKIADLNAKMDELHQRIDGTTGEEVPLKAEVQQAEADLAQVQATEAGLDDKYYKELYSLPEGEITRHIPLAPNGRFTLVEDDPFEGGQDHHYWIFACATRADGRQYWALDRFSIGKNRSLELTIEPTNFLSTKAILRPNLSPDEQDQ
jgi:hypothetical protein